GVPVGTENEPILAVTAEAASSDFVIENDDEGYPTVVEYKGKGGDIVIPNGVNCIGEGVFQYNDTITSVTFPKDCYWVDRTAFRFCTNLKTVTFKGDAMIGDYAFQNCFKLESVKVNGSISDLIGAYAFYDCGSLKTVSIAKDENEFEISGGAFWNCFSLKSINIPSKCTMIYNLAFLNCCSLEKLTIPENTKIYDEDEEKATFGYAAMYKTEDDVEKMLYGDDVSTEYWLADGKKSGYKEVGGDTGFTFTVTDRNTGKTIEFGYTPKKFTPKQLTVTVTKGSPAEKYCKLTKVKYVYAKASSSSSASTAAPANFKASKTTNSVTLSWDAVEGADMYRVYKYNEKTGKYEKYKDVKSAKCSVTGLSAGTKYKFKVTAYDKVNGKYVKGGTSKAVSVTTKK
ncbi:MAG: fibronectin type III domain-containing protein, partial [Muribaculaceae bacterium]|nr:fibronectin type III domain-containing protein [Muribaculaceae bacterium]